MDVVQSAAGIAMPLCRSVSTTVSILCGSLRGKVQAWTIRPGQISGRFLRPLLHSLQAYQI